MSCIQSAMLNVYMYILHLFLLNLVNKCKYKYIDRVIYVVRQ